MSAEHASEPGRWVPAGARHDKPVADEPRRPDWSPGARGVKHGATGADPTTGASDPVGAEQADEGAGIPNFLADLEVAHQTLTEIHFVETMHERKFKMVQLSKGVIALPGGYGTYDELFEILAWRQLKLYDGPIVLLNINGYYDLMLQQLDRGVADGFIKPENRELLLVATTVDDALTHLQQFWEAV